DPFSVTQLGPDLYQRSPFPNATIPNPDKYAVLLYSFYPSPNRTPDDAFQTNNYTAGTVNTTRRHSRNNRIDNRRGVQSLHPCGGSGSSRTAPSGGQFATKQEKQTSHVLSASIAKTRGKWTHKAGTEVRTLLSNYADLEEASVAIASCCAHVGGNYTFQYVTADGSSAAQNTTPAQRGVNGAALLTGSGICWIRPGANL